MKSILALHFCKLPFSQPNESFFVKKKHYKNEKCLFWIPKTKNKLIISCNTFENSMDELKMTDTSQNPSNTLELINVKKNYGERTILSDVSFHLKSGEVVGLLGPNGAGKSTAFSILVGRNFPSEGSVKLGEEDITKLPLEQRARIGIGYLPQEASVFRGLSVEDNIQLVLQETNSNLDMNEKKLNELLNEFNLGSIRKVKGKSLSGGERRRTELARVLAVNYKNSNLKFLLVDEPFAGVDPLGVKEMQNFFKYLSEKKNIGILITDHNVNDALNICDRAYLIFNGKILIQGDVETFRNNELVKLYYLGNS